MAKYTREVLVDMDGVLANFDQRLIEILVDEHPEIQLPERRNSFYLREDVGPRYENIINQITCRPGFFSSLLLIEGALDGWGNLVEAGFSPRICSSPILSNPTCIEEKRGFLEEHFVPMFGPQIVDRAILEKDKTPHKGLALIDDKPIIIGSHKPDWEHVVFDQPYNQESPAKHRLNGWGDDVVGLMAKILLERQ